MDTELGLRERKKQRTRLLIVETAHRLFAEHGFEAVSVAEIAREAEVSEATVFNYFPTKEDLVYQGMEAFEDQLLTAIRERPVGESVIDAFGRFVTQPRGFLAAQDESSRQALLGASRMIAASPALLVRERHILSRYTDSIARAHQGGDRCRPERRPRLGRRQRAGRSAWRSHHIRSPETARGPRRRRPSRS